MTFLQKCVQEKMQELVDEACNNEDPETYFSNVFQETFNSYENWWKFDTDILTIRDVNELLENYQEYRSKYGEIYVELTVDNLIQLFGIEYGESLQVDYAELLEAKNNQL